MLLGGTEIDDADIAEDEVEDGTDGDDSLEAGADAEDEGEPEEGAEDAEADTEEHGEPGAKAPVREPSRAQRRVETALRTAKEAKERAERAEARLSEIERASSGRQTEDQRRAEAERVALMSADEKIEHYRQQDRVENDRRFAALSFQTADRADAAAFESKCARTPALAAVADEVERVLQAERAQGRSGASRETIAAYLIGKKALANAGRAKGKQIKRAAENRERQSARPSSGRSDVGRGSGRMDDKSARAKRLGDMEI